MAITDPRGPFTRAHDGFPVYAEDKKPIRIPAKFDFGHALDALRAGAKVSRDGWNGHNMFIHLQVPDENSKMQLPYLYMRTAHGELVPWVASQTDLLAKDWYIPN
jgi:hypothetical protein